MAITNATLQAAVKLALQTNWSKVEQGMINNLDATANAVAVSVGDHLVSYQYTSVATRAALTAIAAASRTDGLLVLVLGDNTFWRFSSSATTAAGTNVLAPDAGSGRWFRVITTPRRTVRGVVYANVADLAAFTVAGSDGLTYVAGEEVLLANQTTATQCGIYVVGTVGSGTAPLTRVVGFGTGDPWVNGQIVEVSEGTLWAGSTWKAMCTGAKIVGTDDPLFYPRNCRGTTALSSGTKALGATEGLFLFSTTRSAINVSYNTPNTVTASIGLSAPVASRTAGKSGTGALTINAVKTDATTDTGNASTVDWLVTNW